MVLGCSMFLPTGKYYTVGTITVNEYGILLAKRENAASWGVLFGAIGGLISGLALKQFKRISWTDISSIKMKEFRRKKKACYITMLDQTEYVFILPKPTVNIPILQMRFNDSKKMKTVKSVFKD